MKVVSDRSIQLNAVEAKTMAKTNDIAWPMTDTGLLKSGAKLYKVNRCTYRVRGYSNRDVFEALHTIAK